MPLEVLTEVMPFAAVDDLGTSIASRERMASTAEIADARSVAGEAGCS
jgi:hypothetical protein